MQTCVFGVHLESIEWRIVLMIDVCTKESHQGKLLERKHWQEIDHSIPFSKTGLAQPLLCRNF